MVDGANKFQRLLHIDIPCIMPTIIVMFILNMGNLLNVGYEKAYLMQNSLNNQVSEIISTYTYKIGLMNAKYSFSAAVGLANSVINFILIVTTNAISRRMTDNSLW